MGRREEDVSSYWVTKEKREYWKLQKNALARTLCRICFERGNGLFTITLYKINDCIKEQVTSYKMH
jgi:hypothetical protein